MPAVVIYQYQALLHDIEHMHGSGKPGTPSPLRTLLAQAHGAIIALEQQVQVLTPTADTVTLNLEGLT